MFHRTTISFFQFVVTIALIGVSPVRADSLFWAQDIGNDSRILRADLSGANAATILVWPQVSDPIAVVVDTSGGKLYWAQNVGNDSRILRTNLDGTDAQTLVVWPQVSDPKAISLDPVAGKLYWAQNIGNDSRILRADLNGANATTILAWPQVSDPTAIALDSSGGKLYWGQNVGNDSRILRANLDGTSAQTLVVWPQVSDPKAISVDPAGGKLYWAQSAGNSSRLLRADASGANVETLVVWPQVSSPMAIAVDSIGGKVYWAQDIGNDSRILRADANGQNATALLVWPQVSDPTDLSISVDPTPSPGVVVVWNSDPLSPERTTRSLRFKVQAASTATGTTGQSAIKVTMIDLQNPVPPNLPANPPPNFSGYGSATCAPKRCVGGDRNGLTCTVPADCPGTPTAGVCTAAVESNGCARWVGKLGTFLESQDAGPSGGTYRAARLQCTPYYWDWKPEGLIAVYGAEIAPSSEYSVQVYGASCMGAEDGCDAVSAPVTMFTRRSGDVEFPFVPLADAGQPDVTDIAQLVNKFKNVGGAPVKAVAQLQPNLPDMNVDINALDIVAVVDAVKEKAYAFSGPCACPSVVTCGITACSTTGPCLTPYGVGATCVKTCSGGDNAGEPCIDNTHGHCPGGTCGNSGNPNNPGFCRDRCGRCTP